MGLTLVAAAGELKEFYLPAIRELFNSKSMLLNQVRRGAEDVEGAEAVMALHTGRNPGIGAISDGGTLPTAGNQDYTKARVPLRTNTGRIRITVQTIKAMASNRSSWERAAKSEMERIVNDESRDINRQLFGTSDGTIATTAVNAAVNVIVLAATTTKVQMRQFDKNMVVDISTAATPGDAAKASARTITAMDRTAKTITLSGAAITTAAGDRVERKGSGGTGAGQKELTGLQTMCSATGTLFGVDPAVVDVWKAYVDNPGGARTPTENVFEIALDEVADTSSDEIDLFISSRGVLRGYSNQLTSIKRMNDTTELKGGFSALSISSSTGKAGITADRDCPLNTAFGLPTGRPKIHEWSNWEWMEDGAVLRQTPDKLEYEATLFWIAEFGLDNRASLALVGNLTES